MKVLSVVLLFGLAVTIVEPGRSDAMGSLQGFNDFGALIKQGPAALAKKFGFDLHDAVNQLEYWVRLIGPHLEATALKAKIRTLAEILTMIPKAVGVDNVETDFVQMADTFQDKIAAGAQLVSSVVKMLLSTLKTMKF